METLIDEKKLSYCVSIMGCMVSYKRVKMLQLLNDRGEKNVYEITRLMRMEQPEVSHHLGIMYKAGYVQKQRRQKEVFYSVYRARVELLVEVANILG